MITFNEMLQARQDEGYEELLEAIRKKFNTAVKDGDEPVFRTNASGLFELFLENLPEEARQHYNCNACRHFVRRYGGLVTIDERGMLHPVMWPMPVPKFFEAAVGAIIENVIKAKVTDVFVTSDEMLGIPGSAPYVHMAVATPKGMIFNKALKTASQKEAEKREDYLLLLKATQKYPSEVVKSAVNMLRSGMLYRSEAVLGNAEWFLDVKNQMAMRGSYFIIGDENGMAEIESDPPVMREDMVKVGMGAADLRYRGEFRNWKATLNISYNKNGEISFENIVNAINAAGYCCGIGEWRPEKDGDFGRFHVKGYTG